MNLVKQLEEFLNQHKELITSDDQLTLEAAMEIIDATLIEIGEWI